MEKVASEDEAEVDVHADASELKSPANGQRTALEEISYCLGLAKRLVDIELGRIPK